MLSPELLLLALTAAMVGAMVNLTVAFVAAIGVGVIQEILVWNLSSTAQVDLVAVRHGAAGAAGPHRRPPDRGTARGAVHLAARDPRPAAATTSRSRRRVGTAAWWPRSVVVALLPLVVSTGHSFLLSQICIYAVIALSLTVLTGWAGQVSLGQFGLVACGALMAAHLGTSVPLILLCRSPVRSPR